MDSRDLAKTLRPFKIIGNRAAMAPKYRAIQLQPNKVVAASSFAELEITTNIGIEKTCCVSSEAFLAVVDSLPDGEVELTRDGSALAWRCQNAKGRLATMTVDDMPSITRRTAIDGYKPSKQFIAALKRGSVSGVDNALISMDLYGVMIDNSADGLTICSTDSATISAARVDEHINGAESATLPPQGIKLLNAIIDTSGTLQLVNNGVFYSSAVCRCQINGVKPLKVDIKEMVATFSGAETVAPIPRDRIEAFVKRAAALADNRRNATIRLGVADGRIILEFDEGSSSTDEYFLVDDLEGLPEMTAVVLPAIKVASALGYVDRIVLDHIHRGVVVMRGDAPEFVYLVCGSVGDDNVE